MKILKYIITIFLICLSFFYTDKVLEVSMNLDDIMQEIKSNYQKYETKEINATILNNKIIPGLNGKQVDIEASYKKMKSLGTYNDTFYIYKNISPDISIYNNYDKYIINGNKYNNKVALIYIINNSKTIDNILNIIKNNNTYITFFIDSNYLSNNINVLELLKNYEVYNYGLMGNYTKENIIISNNIINNKTNNKSKYCLHLKENIDNLNICANYKMLSIIPNINNYLELLNKLDNGSIILVNNTQELTSIIKYIETSGYKIAPLEEIITE